MCKGDGTGWPQPETQLLFGGDSVGYTYKPRSLGRGVRAALQRGTDLQAFWSALPSEVRALPEQEFGPIKEATLDDIPLEQAVHYSARDADATLRVYNKLMPVIKSEGLYNIYQIDKSILPIIDRMHSNGILIDRQYFKDLDAQFETEQSFILDKLYKLAGKSYNPASPKDVADIVYNTFSCKPIRGSRGTDE